MRQDPEGDPGTKHLDRIARIYGGGIDSRYARRDALRLVRAERSFCETHPQLCKPEEHQRFIDGYDYLITAAQEGYWGVLAGAVMDYADNLGEAPLATALRNLASSIDCGSDPARL